MYIKKALGYIQDNYGHSIRVYIMPKITDVILKGAEQLSLFDTPILFTRDIK